MAAHAYPLPRFEEALLKEFPNREDIQDMARLVFYDDFVPRVDSYEQIECDEIDQVRFFIQAQRVSSEE